MSVTKEISASKTAERLLRKVEKLLSDHKTEQKIPVKAVERLVHELGVHQLELETQNRELRKVQGEIEESRTKYSELYDFAPIGYFIFDRDGLIREVNLTGSKFLNIDRSLLINKPFDSFIPPEFQDVFREHLTQVLSTNTKQTCELRLQREGATPFYAALESIALIASRDMEGDYTQCLSAVSDITEYKRAEEIIRISYDEMEKRVQQRTHELKNITEKLARSNEKLARSNTELRDFVYAASHDLQEPLRVIAGFANLLAKRYKGKLDEKADNYVGFITDGVESMYGVIKDLLEYSRIETTSKSFKSTDSSKALNQAISNLKASVEESGTEITVDALPAIMADDSQIVRLFQNLISNAIKFRSKEPPKIHISAAEVENGWLFSVQDNGIGIDPQYGKRIFVIFQRLHTREEYPGTGLGLTICARIVERHGGTIWVESGIGKGSTFFFTIPALRDFLNSEAV